MGSPDADGNIEPLPWFSHVIFSDDGGGTWELGGVAPADGGNECEVVEIGDGRLALNMRNQRREVAGKTVAGTQALPRGARMVSYSSDGGASFGLPERASALIEPTCMASVRRYAPVGASAAEDLILFSNPASERERAGVTVRLSRDGGAHTPCPSSHSRVCGIA